MSDRVPSVGGGTVGRDHFDGVSVTSLGFTPYTAGHYGLFPSEPLAHYLYWFKIVKKWRVRISLHFTKTVPDGMGGTTEESGSVTMDVKVAPALFDDPDEPTYMLPEREFDLLYPRATGLTLIGTLSPPSTFDTDDLGTLMNSELTATCSEGVSIDIGINYHVPFYISSGGGFSCTWGFSALIGDASVTSNRESTGLTEELTGAFVLTDYNGARTLSAFTNPHSGHDYHVTSFSLLVDAAEYWPYAAYNGSAIYNTSTGAELQSPFN